MRFLLRKIVPCREIIRLEGTVIPIEHNLGLALKQKCQRPARSADIDRLPKAIQHEHMLIKHGSHTRYNCRQTTESALNCQRGYSTEAAIASASPKRCPLASKS